jgi:ribosomal protein S18 acetylase RimI-like enzyme
VSAIRVWALDGRGIEAVRPRLDEVLVDCVEQGASVGFLAPLDPAEADAYWRGVGRAVAEERCVLLVAGVDGGPVAGTVQLDVDTPPNQPHRATVSKLLVHSGARRRGVGEALMAAVEGAAREAGRWLLTLDTATADAERLYRRLGWRPAGVIPRYAVSPDGTLTDTVLYWKQLAPEPTSVG